MNARRLHRASSLRRTLLALTLCTLFIAAPLAAHAQTPATPPQTHYLPSPAFDTASINKAADPCTDFYKYACGNFAAANPIPSDQPAVDQFYTLYNVNTQELNGILTKYAAPDPPRTPNQQKIGDYYAACMNTALINQKGLAPLQPLLDKINAVSKNDLASLAGELQRINVNVFLSFGEEQDFKDSSKQVAVIDQGGLGLPERDYYTRTGDKDKQIRAAYVTHIAKMLTLAGETPAQAATDATNILAFETKLAEASMTNTERRDPEAVYHPQSLAAFQASLHGVNFAPFFEAVHAPPIDSLINANPKFFPAMIAAVRATDMDTLRAYLRYQTLTSFAGQLPQPLDAENFDFYGRELQGTPSQRPRWKRCSTAVDGALGEALGQVYVQQYFAGDSKAKTLQMVHDIEAAMDKDIDTLEWMSPATRVRAKEKLHAIADKSATPTSGATIASSPSAPTTPSGIPSAPSPSKTIASWPRSASPSTTTSGA